MLQRVPFSDKLMANMIHPSIYYDKVVCPSYAKQTQQLFQKGIGVCTIFYFTKKWHFVFVFILIYLPYFLNLYQIEKTVSF